MEINTEEDYIKAIPSWCSLETMQDHHSIMLCWGITNGRVANGGEDYCKTCEFHKANQNDRQQRKEA